MVVVIVLGVAVPVDLKVPVSEVATAYACDCPGILNFVFVVELDFIYKPAPFPWLRIRPATAMEIEPCEAVVIVPTGSRRVNPGIHLDAGLVLRMVVCYDPCPVL